MLKYILEAIAFIAFLSLPMIAGTIVMQLLLYRREWKRRRSR